MFCSKCGTENPETASFCSKCGEPINGAVTPVAKKKNKFLWIGGAILAVILLCCVAPLGYGYVKIKSIPTSTPFPTSTPEPTQDVAGIAYGKAQLELVGKELSVVQEISSIVNFATKDDYYDTAWQNKLYAKFDELISIANESAKMPCPSGYESIQENFQKAYSEYVQAKDALKYAFENKDGSYFTKVQEHVKYAGQYIELAGELIKAKGY